MSPPGDREGRREDEGRERSRVRALGCLRHRRAAGGIWRSWDQGQTWTPLPDSSLGIPYRSAACPDRGVCILVGPGKPVVLRDRDATAISSPTTGSIRAIACESETTCTVADSLAHVISISDPWRNWDSPVRLPHDLDAISLSCPAPQTCVGLSGKGPALRTTGRSSGDWTKRPTGTADLLAVDCDGTICAAVGKAARWYGSEDTGFQWDQANPGREARRPRLPYGGTGSAWGRQGRDRPIDHRREPVDVAARGQRTGCRGALVRGASDLHRHLGHPYVRDP